MSALDIEILPVLSDNYVYVIHDRATGTTGVVDPPEVDPVLTLLEERNWTLDWILATHHHADHTAGIEELKRRTSCRVVGPRAESDRIAGLDVRVGEGDRFRLGDSEANVLDTPGHTSGHITYWFAESRALFCADALFSLGCGRIFEGTPAQMWASLEKLRRLPDDARVYCGHEYTLSNARFALTVDSDNPVLRGRVAEVEKLAAQGVPTIPTLLGEEKVANPFLRPDDPGIRAFLGMADATDAEVFAEIRGRKDRA